MRLGDQLQFHHLLGYGKDTQIQAEATSWSTYVLTKDDERIAFSIRQDITFCLNLGLSLPDLSDHARHLDPLYDGWK